MMLQKMVLLLKLFFLIGYKQFQLKDALFTIQYLIHLTKLSIIISYQAMQRIEELLQSIKTSIKKEIKDHSLVAQLNKELQHTQITSDLVSGFTKAVFSLYDLSNHHSLVQRVAVKNNPVKFEHDEMAFLIKLTVFKMLSSLVIFYSQNPNIELPLPLLRQSLQIMVLIARIFIDVGQGSQIKPLYSLVNTFHQATSSMSAQIQMLHYLNAIQLMRMDVDRALLDVYQFKKNTDHFYQLAKRVANSVNYIELAQHITLQVILKLIKTGNADKCKMLKSFLPQKLMETLNAVTNFESRLLQTDLPQMKISPFYQLFLSLKQGGRQQISQQRLRAFITSGQNFNDPRVFDVVALTGCLLPLQIWLQTYINTKQRCQNITNGYKCFVYVTDKYFSANPVSPDLAQKHQQTLSSLGSYISLSQLVMLGLLLEKKDSQQPILSIMKRILKVLIHCIINLYPDNKLIRDFGDKLLMICSKFGLGDLSKSVHCIIFYYQVLMGTANEESFNRFYKNNLMQKGSHIFKTIKLAYQMRTNKTRIGNEDIQSIKRQPYLAVLFQRQLKDNIILSISPQQFCRLPEKFQIYFMLTSNLSQLEIVECNVAKLANHMQQTLIRIDISQISKLDLRYISMISTMFLKMLNECKDKVSINIVCRLNVVLLYLVSFTYFNHQISNFNTGILLNRYSKLMKILSLGFESVKNLSQAQRNECIQKYLYLSKTMLCWSLEQLKLLNNSGTHCLEPGSLTFYDLLMSFILQNEKTSQNIEFIRFIRFQIACLTDTVSDNQITLEKNLKLLKVFCSSKWIKKNVKLKILRKLIREDLVSQSRQVTLQDLNDLIILAESPKQRKMYAQYLIKLFGQQGKTYLLMQSSTNASAYQFLTSQDQNEDDD